MSDALVVAALRQRLDHAHVIHKQPPAGAEGERALGRDGLLLRRPRLHARGLRGRLRLAFTSSSGAQGRRHVQTWRRVMCDKRSSLRPRFVGFCRWAVGMGWRDD